MRAPRATPSLKRDLERFYQLREPICNADVRGEYIMLRRRGYAGVCGNARMEALRRIFIKHGTDPLDGLNP